MMSPGTKDAIKGSPERKCVPASPRAVVKPCVLRVGDKTVRRKFSRKGTNGLGVRIRNPLLSNSLT